MSFSQTPGASLLSLVASHDAYGQTTKLFRHNCPEWLTPKLIEAQGFQALALESPDGLPRFQYERQDADGLRYLIRITACGEFRMMAGFGGHCCGYSQHHGGLTAFAGTVEKFISDARYAQKSKLARAMPA